jgi:hypothetical protein
MGTWGGGLYADDYAVDLRESISGVARLPYDGDKLLVVLRKEESCADHGGDQDHYVFWLVTADQFTRRGITSREATRRALEIIDNGLDFDRLRVEGMPASALRQREKQLAELAERLRHPPPAKPRKTLKKPQPLLLQTGQAWCYPTMKREARNPYFATAESEGFKQNGWGAFLVVKTGLAFEMIAWYAVVPVHLRSRNKPTLESIQKARFYLGETFDSRGRAKQVVMGGAGTLSQTHLKRMGLELLGEFRIATRCVSGYLTAGAKNYAVTNRSLSNQIMVQSCGTNGPLVSSWLAD